jgi:hypothetical protein
VVRTLSKLHRDGFVERAADRWRLAIPGEAVAPAEGDGPEFVP